MNDYKIMWEQFIKESPWLTPSTPDSFNQKMENMSVIDISSKYEYLQKFENYYVYENDNELFFNTDDEFVAYYRYLFDDNGICHTKMTWNRKNHKGTFLKIFAEYIIPLFKVVESDDMMTPEAFSMWQKLIGNYTQYDYYIKDGDYLIPIDNPYDVHNYKEKISLSGKSNSTFLVSYK